MAHRPKLIWREQFGAPAKLRVYTTKLALTKLQKLRVYTTRITLDLSIGIGMGIDRITDGQRDRDTS